MTAFTVRVREIKVKAEVHRDWSFYIFRVAATAFGVCSQGSFASVFGKIKGPM